MLRPVEPLQPLWSFLLLMWVTEWKSPERRRKKKLMRRKKIQQLLVERMRLQMWIPWDLEIERLQMWIV
jgi:hypothetical protein